MHDMEKEVNVEYVKIGLKKAIPSTFFSPYFYIDMSFIPLGCLEKTAFGAKFFTFS